MVAFHDTAMDAVDIGSAAEICSASTGLYTWTIISINAVDNPFFILACMVANAVNNLIKL